MGDPRVLAPGTPQSRQLYHLRIRLQTSLVRFPRRRVGGRAGPGDPPQPAVLLSAPHAGGSRGTPYPGHQTWSSAPHGKHTCHPSYATPKLTHSLTPARRGPCQPGKGRGPPSSAQPTPGRRALILPPRCAPTPSPPGPLPSASRRGSARPQGSEAHAPAEPGALPENRWLGGEVRTPFGSAIFPWSGEPRGVPCVPAPVPPPPPSPCSIWMRCSHGPTAHCLRPCVARSWPCSARVLTRHAHSACTCDVRTGSHAANAHTGPHAAGAHRVHVQGGGTSSPSARTQRACTLVVHTHQWKHTSPCSAHSKRYTVFHTACEQRAHTPCARTCSLSTHMFSHIVHTRLHRAR